MEPPKLGITISDYLFYPGEGSENCINNTKELFGWEISEDNIEDDVEIVASPRDTRDTRGTPPGSQPQLRPAPPRPMPLVAAVAGLGMATIAMGLAQFNLGSREDSEQ